MRAIAKKADDAKSTPLNRSLHAAKSAKQDEFYTQYVDIQKEVEAYPEFDPDTFKGKIVYCNCDDPFESNFFKYFAANFNKLGLKKLICTSYDGSPIAGQMSLFPEHTEGNGHRPRPKAVGVIVDQVKDENNDGATDINDVNRHKATCTVRNLRRPRAMRDRLDPPQDHLGPGAPAFQVLPLLWRNECTSRSA